METTKSKLEKMGFSEASVTIPVEAERFQRTKTDDMFTESLSVQLECESDCIKFLETMFGCGAYSNYMRQVSLHLILVFVMC